MSFSTPKIIEKGLTPRLHFQVNQRILKITVIRRNKSPTSKNYALLSDKIRNICISIHMYEMVPIPRTIE